MHSRRCRPVSGKSFVLRELGGCSYREIAASAFAPGNYFERNAVLEYREPLRNQTMQATMIAGSIRSRKARGVSRAVGDRRLQKLNSQAVSEDRATSDADAWQPIESEQLQDSEVARRARMVTRTDRIAGESIRSASAWSETRSDAEHVTHLRPTSNCSTS
jgi:hypothetical protein